MRHVSVFTRENGRKVWRFTPPPDARLAGVVTSKQWDDGRKARYEAIRLNKRIDDWRAGNLPSNITPDSPMNVVISWWIEETQPYRQLLTAINATRESIGARPLKDMTGQYVLKIYNRWLLEESTSYANQKLSTLIKCIDYCVLRDIIKANPLRSIQKARVEYDDEIPETAWTEETADEIINALLSDVYEANFGVIMILMAATLRPAQEIAELTWDDIDLEKGEITTDDKIFVVSSSVLDLLQQQHDRFGHQKWVAPHLREGIKALYPYQNTSRYFSQLKSRYGWGEGYVLTGYRDFCIQQKVNDGATFEQLKLATGMSNTRLFKFIESKEGGNVIQFPVKES